MFQEFHVLTGTAPRPFRFRGQRFRAVAFPRKLVRAGKERAGVETRDRAGLDLAVTGVERTLVDLFDRPDLGGGVEEVWRSLAGVEFFDLEAVTEYALLLGNATTVAKVGFFLEAHRERLMVSEAHLACLRRHRPRQPHYFEKTGLRQRAARRRMEPRGSEIRHRPSVGGTVMRLSRERLDREAKATGFRVEILEKVALLLDLLDGFDRHPYLKGRLALKGGTALNLFIFDAPRLSIDIDLNYVGQLDREAMLAERPKVDRALGAVCGRAGITIDRTPGAHAGGKWRLRYGSADGRNASLELDVNYMLRAPLWDPVHASARSVGTLPTPTFPILDIHEVAAGKLAALFARRASRDLFDAHQLLLRGGLDPQRLRIAFVVYGAMNRKDWRTVSVDDIAFEPRELRNQLVPTLRSEAFGDATDPITWARSLDDECREALRVMLPLSEAELEFLDRLLDHGEIVPALLTTDPVLRERIAAQPMLAWKALHADRYRDDK